MIRSNFMHIGILSFSILAVHALAAVFFTYLHRIRTEPYLRMWTIGWYLLVLHDLTIGPTYGLGASSPGLRAGLMLAARFLLAACAVAFFCAARLYMNSSAWTPAALLTGSWLGLYVVSAHFGYPWIASAGILALRLSIAFVFLQAARRRESHGDWVLAAAFAGWALL